tara:strand:- start:5762 stop:5983 length:222 start_codon:yes stop_codon:yes gene_type:complete
MNRKDLTSRFDASREIKAIQSHLSDELDAALYGRVGILSNPLRFAFYSLIFGAANIIIIQTITGAIGRARDED